MPTIIHPSAVVEPGAVIGDGCNIGVLGLARSRTTIEEA
jgi:acyl-[acyl carrier protein]--UDP-N-acetylglucosamine O-acyltransferase